jgi:hypothetical protein
MLKTRPAKIALLLCCLCLVALVAVTVVKAIEDNRVLETLTIEAGSPLPPASRFLNSSASNEAAYVGDVSSIDTTKPGSSKLQVSFRGRTFDVTLEIRDTIAPTADVRALDLYDGETAKASDFVDNIRDATAVTVAFKEQPDFSKVNTQDVTILLTDAAGNVTEYPSTMRVSKVKAEITLEAAASGTALDVRQLLKNAADAGDASWAETPPAANQVGCFVVRVRIGGQTYESAVVLQDTVAPTGSVKNLTVWLGDPVEAAQFIANVRDVTAVAVSYQSPPDFAAAGDQTVTLVLTDAGNNQTTLAATLTVIKDEEAPVIYGVKKYTLYIGQTATYKKGVYAQDNKDGEVEIKVDSSGVNPRAEGTYTAVYSATDLAGNTVSVDVAVTVIKESVTLDEVNAVADQVLAEITTPGMTLKQKAEQIFHYVNTHIYYTGDSDKTDWMKEAKRGIIEGSGDCFTYYSVAHLLLERVGIQTLTIERDSKPGESHHYWHEINYGEGWYYFDATSLKLPLDHIFMTLADLDAYSALIGHDNYFYRFDRENYPPTADMAGGN